MALTLIWHRGMGLRLVSQGFFSMALGHGQRESLSLVLTLCSLAELIEIVKSLSCHSIRMI